MTKDITEKQQYVLGYLIGTISYMTATPDLYDPKWTKDTSDLVDSHKQEFGLTDSEAEGLKELVGEVLEYVRNLEKNSVWGSLN